MYRLKMRPNRQSVVCCLLIWLALFPATAAAQTLGLAEQLQLARTAHRAAKYRVALFHYLAALELDPSPDPKVLGDIAQCYHAQNKPAKAVTFYRRFLKRWKTVYPHRPVPHRREIEGRIAALEKQILPKEPQPASQPASKPASQPAASHRPATSQPASQPSPPAKLRESAPNRNKSIAGYTLLAAGIASLVASATLYGVGFESRNYAHFEYWTAPNQTERDLHWNEISAADDKIVAGHVLAALGVATFATSLYFLLIRDATEKASTPRLTVAPGIGSLHIALKAEF
jgi:hypothetical protein